MSGMLLWLRLAGGLKERSILRRVSVVVQRDNGVVNEEGIEIKMGRRTMEITPKQLAARLAVKRRQFERQQNEVKALW